MGDELDEAGAGGGADVCGGGFVFCGGGIGESVCECDCAHNGVYTFDAERFGVQRVVDS